MLAPQIGLQFSRSRYLSLSPMRTAPMLKTVTAQSAAILFNLLRSVMTSVTENFLTVLYRGVIVVAEFNIFQNNNKFNV